MISIPKGSNRVHHACRPSWQANNLGVDEGERDTNSWGFMLYREESRFYPFSSRVSTTPLHCMFIIHLPAVKCQIFSSYHLRFQSTHTKVACRKNIHNYNHLPIPVGCWGEGETDKEEGYKSSLLNCKCHMPSQISEMAGKRSLKIQSLDLATILAHERWNEKELDVCSDKADHENYHLGVGLLLETLMHAHLWAPVLRNANMLSSPTNTRPPPTRGFDAASHIPLTLSWDNSHELGLAVPRQSLVDESLLLLDLKPLLPLRSLACHCNSPH